MELGVEGATEVVMKYHHHSPAIFVAHIREEAVQSNHSAEPSEDDEEMPQPLDRRPPLADDVSKTPSVVKHVFHNHRGATPASIWALCTDGIRSKVSLSKTGAGNHNAEALANASDYESLESSGAIAGAQ
eukprot:4398125-Amphidinium_carterae.1